MRRYLRPNAVTVIFVMVMTMLHSCGSRRSGTPTVAVSIPPLAFFAREIGGDKVRVETLAPASANPETFEPSMAQMRGLADSQILLTTGLLPFEVRIAGSLDGNTTIVNLSDSVELITGTHGDGEADPHIWTSLRNAKKMARQVAAALSEAYPEHAGYFEGNLHELEAKLDAEDEAAARRLLPFRGGSFLVWHPSLSYFARDYGLNQIVLGEENKEISISQLRNRIEQAKADSALVFFFQKEFDTRQAQIVTEATGLQPVEITPLSSDILGTVNVAAEAVAGR